MQTGQTALLIIDMQNDFVLPESPACISGALRTVPTIASVLQSFRQAELPIFHIVREYRADGSDIERFRFDRFINGAKQAIPGTFGSEIVDALTPTDSEYRIVKPRFSAFMSTELDLMLRRLNIAHIVMTGTQIPNCIRATAYDAVALGYQVTLLTDATSAMDDTIAQANINDMRNIDITCIPSTSLELA